VGVDREHEAIDQLSRALTEVGLDPALLTSAGALGDLLVRGPHGVQFTVALKQRALVRDGDIPTLTRGLTAADRRRGMVGVVVADRITEEAKNRLRAKSWGWLDLRGDLHLEAPGVFIDARIGSAEPVIGLPREPLAGAVGLELASLLLMHPARSYGVREAAAELARAPSSVSQELSRLRTAGLTDASNRPVLPDLFHALSRRWRPLSVDVATVPEPGASPINDALRLGLDDPEHQPGWALGDTLAAIAYGAPVGATGDYPPDLYVPDRSTLRRAAQLLGTVSTHQERAATLRVAPVPMATSQRIDRGTRATQGWPLVHLLFVALDLAQDPDRGTEVLAAWEPPGEWHRVW
jgi:hypothetical protein